MLQFEKYDPEHECEKIMQRIKGICIIRGISLNVLANAAGISKSTVHDLINGKNKPYMYTMYKICNALEIPVEILLDDKFLKVEKGLTSDESELLKYYSYMSDEKRRLFRIFMEMFKAYDEREVSKKFEIENSTTGKEN